MGLIHVSFQVDPNCLGSFSSFTWPHTILQLPTTVTKSPTHYFSSLTQQVVIQSVIKVFMLIVCKWSNLINHSLNMKSVKC
jgi:hypothetical protein